MLDPFMNALGLHAETLAPGQARVWGGSGRNFSTVGDRRTAVYRVEGRDGEKLLALFTGTAYRKTGQPTSLSVGP